MSPKKDKTIVIVGGGLSGLSAAYHLVKKIRGNHGTGSVILIEKERRFGGKAWTIKEDGFLVEAGPDSFITTKPFALKLCEELRLSERIIGTNPRARKVFILWKGRLRAVPHAFLSFRPDLFSVLNTDLLSWRGKWAALTAPFKHYDAPQEDVSVRDFFEKLLGKEATERIVLPLVNGIYGAAGQEVSVRWTLPTLWNLFRQPGKKTLLRLLSSALRPANRSGRSFFVTLLGGIGELVDVLAEEVAPYITIIFDSAQTLIRTDGSYELTLSSGQTITADGVILAANAWEVAALMKHLDGDLAKSLAALPYRSSLTISLAFHSAQIAQPLEGSGFLIPEAEGSFLSGCTFSSVKFPGRAPEGFHLLRCFVALGDPSATNDQQEDQIVRKALNHLAPILQIKGQPIKWWLFRWEKALPLYRVGHHLFLAEVEASLTRLTGLAFAGNWLRGIGIPDCLASGKEAADKVWGDLYPNDRT
ncbi:MAG: protoporphyrinogen oxidase [Armatimonadetes bacterium]|nr:protoporphyrinogen oxidase [Armatimonadota bacterium]MDW8122366.1 protoporphyrinogen oxidase [Armatimonadota bacterium]